jgi:hypothetical protein
MFFLLLSTLLAAAAAQQCQASGRPCALSTSSGGNVMSGGVGVCVAAMGSLGQCSPQCRDASSNACFLSTSSSTTDGICQASPGSNTLTCVAKQNPNPNPACTVDRPCTLSTNTVGVCQTVNGAATCKPQCQQTASGTPTMATACFPDLMSTQRDGVCNPNLVCVRQTTEPPACDIGSKCRLSNSAEVGICGQGGVCGKQCQSTLGGMGSSSGCYTSFNVNNFDGQCENGTCKPKTVTPPAACQKVFDACQTANNVGGKCTKSSDGALQCSVLTNCNSMSSPAGTSSCTYVSMDGYLKSGVCSPNGCVPPAPQCQVGGPCKTADGADGKLTNTCDCAKQENPIVQQCSANTEGSKCQLATNGVVSYGVCKEGKCDGGSTPQCQVGGPCKAADGTDSKFTNTCECPKSENPNPVVQQCSPNTEGQKCQLPSAGISSMSGFGVCKQSKCEGGNTPQCQVGGPCKAADGTDSKFTNTCECPKGENPNPVVQQCSPNTEGQKCQASNTATGGFGVCKQSKCEVGSTPQCERGGLCTTKDNFEGKFNDICECVKRPVPNEVCPKDGEKCQVPTLSGNTMSTQTGVCAGGKCVVQNTPPTPCKDGAFCAPSEGQRGVCRSGKCETVKCMSDDNCLSSDSSTKRVCQAYQCVPAPSTMSNPCSSNIKCENGGKCVVVNGANAGFSDAQLKQSVEVASTFNNLAGVCVCPGGWTGATCSNKVETPAEKPASCSCNNGMVSRDNLCVQLQIKACTCDQKCVCTNDSSDKCSAPEKMGVPSSAPTGSTLVLSVVFAEEKANLLQALGTVKALLEKYDSIQINAEKTDVGLRVTVVVKGDIDPELAGSVKAAAATLLNREDVVDAVVQDAAVDREPAMPSSASSVTIGAAAVLIAAIVMN